MYFDSFHQFLEMGGYAFYVWGAYSVCFVTFLWLILSATYHRKAVIREIRQKIVREERIQAAEKLENSL
jgi:heme exporter protein D